MHAIIVFSVLGFSLCVKCSVYKIGLLASSPGCAVNIRICEKLLVIDDDLACFFD